MSGLKNRSVQSPANSAPMTNESAELAELLLATFTKAFSSLRAECRAQNRGAGLTMVQLRALSLLMTADSTNRDLAGEIGLSIPATSRLIGTLKEQGLVQSFENPNDRRESFLRPTSGGKKTLERFQASACARYAERLSKIPASKKKGISEVLWLLSNEVL